MRHWGPQSGARSVSIPNTSWRMWTASEWPGSFGMAPALSPSPPAGLHHLTGPSPSGHGPGVLPSRGEQYFFSLLTGLTPGESDKESLASGAWQAGQRRPVSAAALSRCQHTWPPGHPSVCGASAPAPPLPHPPRRPSRLHAAQESPLTPTQSQWAGGPSSQQAGGGERALPRPPSPTAWGAAHFHPWKEAGRLWDHPQGKDSSLRPFSQPLGSWLWAAPGAK